jgi:3-phenylpropionate/cinnamic acid dioxygenase small subunit
MTTLDRAALADIEDVLVRYATGIDRRDWTALRSCFTDDCHADYGDTGEWHSGDEITEWMRVIHEQCGHTMHRLTNIVIEPDGLERATARSYVDAIVMGPDDVNGAHAVGYYDDELVQTDGEWRIARRRFTSVLLRWVSGG